MTFEEFKGVSFHTKNTVRIPGTNVVIDKQPFVTEKGFDHKKLDEAMKDAYIRYYTKKE